MTKQKPTTAETRDGYEVGVSGVYYSLDQSTGIKTKKFYKNEAFRLPKIIKYKQGMKKITITQDDGTVIEKVVPDMIESNSLTCALHIIRRYHIEERLKEKYPDYIGVHTCEIFSKEKIKINIDELRDVESTPIKDMTLSELLQFVTLSDINVILGDYADLGDKKIAVQRALAQKKKDDKTTIHSQPTDELEEDIESSLLG